MRVKWRDNVDRIIEREARDVTIKDVNDFVTAKARAATHPIFGKVSIDKAAKFLKQPNSKFQQQNKASGFAIQSAFQNLKCPQCSSNHWYGCLAATNSRNSLSKKDRSLSERRSFATIVYRPVISFEHVQTRVSAKSKDVLVNIQPFFTQKQSNLQVKGKETPKKTKTLKSQNVSKVYLLTMAISSPNIPDVLR